MQVSPRAASFLRPHAGLFLVFLSGTVISLFLFLEAEANSRQEIRRRFEMDAHTRMTFYLNDLKERLIDLGSIQRFYDGSEEVKPHEFTAFVAPIFSDRPGAHAIVWAPPVRQVSGEVHFPVTLVESPSDHAAILGFDGQAEPQCRLALIKAMDSGFPTVTNLITLPGGKPEEPGFLVYVPVYERGLPLTTVSERRKNLKGFVIGMFDPQEVATIVMSQLPSQGLFLDLIDAGDQRDKHLIHHWISRKPSFRSGFPQNPLPSALDLQFSRNFRFADRQWELLITATDSYVEGLERNSGWLVLLTGFTLTILLTLYLQTILSHQEKTEALVAERTLALSDSEKHYRSLAQNLPGIVYRIDIGAGGTMTFLNDMLETLTGYAPGDLSKSQFFALYPFVHPDDRMKVVESLEQAMANGQPFQAEYRLKVKSGKFLFFSEYGRPLRDDEGKTAFIEGVIFDITARKIVEAEKEKLLGELKQKNKELEAIVYVASHDLRSPLVNIQGFTHRLEKFFVEISAIFKQTEISETAAKSLHELLQEQAPKALHYIKSSSTKMNTLIDGLLKISRTGRASLVMEKLDMDAMFEAILAAMNFQIQSQQVAIHFEPLPPCFGDSVQINQVFSNLLDNALKYRAPDRSLEIWVTGRRENDKVMYWVRDSGRGIDREHQEKIWEIFHRLDPQGSVAGEGLGLTLAKRIVERHKGRITVESTLGQGSCFFIELPA